MKKPSPMQDTPLKGFDYIGVGVVYFCHDGHGKFIMSKRGPNCRDEHGRWDPGGGGIEFGASMEETLRKEIAEEYCTVVKDFEFLGYRDVYRTLDNKPSHWVIFDYKVLVDPTQVKNGEPHKFEAVEWFSLDALPENLHSQFPHFIEKYGLRLR